MKIALVFLGRRGGGALYSLEMAKALNTENEILAFVSVQAENIADWRKSGLQIVEIDTYHDLLSFLLASLNVGKFLFIRSRIRNFAADVVYYPFEHQWVPFIQYLLSEKPQILTLHDPESHSGEENIFLQLLLWCSIRQASGIVLLSSVFKDSIRAKGFSEEKIAIIPHGEFSFYSHCHTTNAPTATNGVMLFFGRISEYKGIGVLLQAFRLIAQQCPQARLILVGSGDITKYRRQIEAIPAHQIEIVNKWISDGEVYQYFSRASFVVLPYMDATQSGVIAIAYGFGLPVVASRVGGLVEQVKEGITGFLVEPGNVEELVGKCRELLHHPEQARQLGDNALKLTRQELSWPVLGKALSNFLKTFVK